MGSAFHQLCPRYSGTLTPTAPTAIRLWDACTFTLSTVFVKIFLDGSIRRNSGQAVSEAKPGQGLYFCNSDKKNVRIYHT